MTEAQVVVSAQALNNGASDTDAIASQIDQQLVDAYGLRSRVHVLGVVDRRTLAALYRGAFAVLVPSLYEQASYQIAEAMYCNVPVACARIPPFLEQCAPLGDAIVYFEQIPTMNAAESAMASPIWRRASRARNSWHRSHSTSVKGSTMTASVP